MRNFPPFTSLLKTEAILDKVRLLTNEFHYRRSPFPPGSKLAQRLSTKAQASVVYTFSNGPCVTNDTVSFPAWSQTHCQKDITHTLFPRNQHFLSTHTHCLKCVCVCMCMLKGKLDRGGGFCWSSIKLDPPATEILFLEGEGEHTPERYTCIALGIHKPTLNCVKYSFWKSHWHMQESNKKGNFPSHTHTLLSEEEWW